MKQWSSINIKLLTLDCCHNILQKAITILDGLYTYWEEILGPMNWPTHVTQNPILFLIKLYFHTDFTPEIEKITQYFELDVHSIYENLIQNMNINFLENQDDNQISLITQTISAFDEILKSTTTLLWDANQKII